MHSLMTLCLSKEAKTKANRKRTRQYYIYSKINLNFLIITSMQYLLYRLNKNLLKIAYYEN